MDPGFCSVLVLFVDAFRYSLGESTKAALLDWIPVDDQACGVRIEIGAQ